MFCSAGLCLSALSACAALSALPDTEEENSDDFGLSQALEASASCVGWAANLAYLFYLSGSAHPSHRGPRVLTVAFLLCLAADAVNTRSVVMDRVRGGGQSSLVSVPTTSQPISVPLEPLVVISDVVALGKYSRNSILRIFPSAGENT